MKLTIKTLLKATLPAILLVCASPASHASSIDIIGYENAKPQSVIGVWSSTNKVTFDSSGKYSISLSDFGLASSMSSSFGSNFSYLGAMISSSNGNNLGSVTFNKNSTQRDLLVSFDITKGDYWLSLFAITDSNTNAGTFNMNLLAGDVSPVPLPASFWFMATSLLGLFSFFRQSKVAKSSMATA